MLQSAAGVDRNIEWVVYELNKCSETIGFCTLSVQPMRTSDETKEAHYNEH